ncbi:hypothetical protein V6N12_042602 [Hibiscus sabdariffa]|uniref:Reverse transcriptase zinc-binding domain-containing protein n=1 Tax=Hibiscus sabdariffa TaxID=183260 RepID=A0ABR2EF94_9ROSI
MFDMVTSSGDWNRDLISRCLPNEVLQHIATIPPSRSDIGSDMVGWHWESNRCFLTKSAYTALSPSMASGCDQTWRKIWKLKVMDQVKVLMWLAYHDRLLTNVERCRRHLGDSDVCSLYCVNSFGAQPNNSDSLLSAHVVWQKPSIGWVKVNCDGARRLSDGMTVARGLIRDA